MPLHANIHKRLDKLDSRTTSLFHELAGVSPELLTRRPQPGYWNVLEAINHIYLSEKLSLRYVRHKLTQPETIPVRRADSWLRTLAVKWVLYSPLKFKAPPQINMQNSQPVLPLTELSDLWKQDRAALREILERHEPAFRQRLLYKHPYAGRMTLAQMLIFFDDHLVHHTRQIRRIINQLNG